MTSEAPGRKLLTPCGGLPNGNWPEGELVEYIRADLHQQALEAAEARGYARAVKDVLNLPKRVEALGGQRYTYVRCEEIRALSPSPADPVAEAARVLWENIPNPIFDELKGLLIGEFSIPRTEMDEDGEEVNVLVPVDWTTTKEIISTAFRALAQKEGE